MSVLKFRFRLLWDAQNEMFLFIPKDFPTIKMVAMNNDFYPWPYQGRQDTWRLKRLSP